MHDAYVSSLIKRHQRVFPIGLETECSDFPEGWIWIVDDLLHSIVATLTTEELIYFRVTQIKDKFGELRFYWRGKNSVVVATLIKHAKARSRRTCMECGDLGARYKPGFEDLCTFCINETDIRAKSTGTY